MRIKLNAMIGVVIVSTVIVGLMCAGCKKRSVSPAPSAAPELEPVVTNRMSDVSYIKALDQVRKAQLAKATERSAIVDKMKSHLERVRASLPAGADDAAVKAALAKDGEWRKLEAQNAQVIGEIEQTLADARKTVRERMLAESRAIKAVAEGKARAVDPAAAK